MPDRLEIGGYTIEFDRDATAAAYSHFDIPEPEKCGCWNCRNWAAGRERMVPNSVGELLSRLGIPITGEIEVWEAPKEKSQHLYAGWYMVVGRVVVQPPIASNEFILGEWRLSWSAKPSYEMSQFGGHEVCELHFLVAEVPNFIAREDLFDGVFSITEPVEPGTQ